jgi:hypothetical protein
MAKTWKYIRATLARTGYSTKETTKNIKILNILKNNTLHYIDGDNIKKTNLILENTLIKSTKKYDIILVFGQSNTCYGTGLDPTIDFAVDGINQIGRYGENNHKIIQAIEPLQNSDEFLITSNRIGLALTFAKLYKEHYLASDREIVIIPCGKGSSGFINNFWNPGDSSYEDAILRTNEVLNLNFDNRLVAILWQQGEADTWNINYQQNLDNMITNLRNDIVNYNIKTPFLLGGFVPYWLNLEDTTGTVRKETTNNIIKDTQNRLPYCYYVDPSSPTVIEKENPEVESVHYDAPSLRELSARYFEKYQSHIFKITHIQVPGLPTR